MINRIAAVVCVVLWLEQVGYVDAKAAMQVQPLQSAQTYRPPSSTDLRVVLLGTEPGPTVTLDQFGVSTLVEAAGMRLLFDCDVARRSGWLRRIFRSAPSRDCF